MDMKNWFEWLRRRTGDGRVDTVLSRKQETSNLLVTTLLVLLLVVLFEVISGATIADQAAVCAVVLASVSVSRVLEVLDLDEIKQALEKAAFESRSAVGSFFSGRLGRRAILSRFERLDFGNKR